MADVFTLCAIHSPKAYMPKLAPLSPPVRAAGQASSRSPRLVTPAAAVDCNMPVITPPESFDSRMPVLKPPPGVNHTMIVRIVPPCFAKR
jgi:hypothetical protein